ncbi:MAG: tetratricopeptide repeat protein [Deltaproteobacteria bacterium]|nr:tetratricopeptide repeat protein [Deltaproteobacteria bacterium]
MDQTIGTPTTSSTGDIADRVRRRLFDAQSTDLHIGRFRVLEPLGQGNMGMVYAAYDEQLDRKVAVKVMLDDALPWEEDRLRFQREGQALARLSHPNVVAVHEVGSSNGQFYLAMEYVRGESLDRWLTTKPAWHQILDAFVQAGRGLAAAHRADLVHRDLKPSNIMRSDEGAVKVVDFGIARLTPNEFEESLDVTSASSSLISACETLTRTGVVLGTPVYMAPEQFTSTGADDRSDQYAFCVALWEGLTGHRPFDAQDIDSLLGVKLGGPPRWPNRAAPVPKVVVEALRRGLSVDPLERWPSMDELLAALSWDPQRRRNNRTLAVAVLAVVGLGATTVNAWNEGSTPQCSGARASLTGVWDEARRSDVETAIAGADASYAEGVRSRTLAAIDDYADAWTTAHTEACEATTIRGEQSPRVMDLRMSCLHRAANQLSATVDTLADADADVVRKAHRLTSNLPPLLRCADIEALEAEGEPPLPAEAAAVDLARQLLARAKSSRTAGRYEPARDAVNEAAEVLHGVTYRPVLAEINLVRGGVLEDLGQNEAAERALLEAIRYTSQRQQPRLMATALGGLVRVVGGSQERVEAVALFEPLLRGLADGEASQAAVARSAIVALLSQRREFEAAEAEARQVLALEHSVPAPDPVVLARSRKRLGAILNELGKYAEAEAEFRASLELTAGALGFQHPEVAECRHNLGIALRSQGKHDEAEFEARAALAGLEHAVGPDHLDTTNARSSLGHTLFDQGKYSEAEAEYQAALRINESVLGPAHPRVAKDRENLAGIMIANGRFAEAEALYRSSLAAKLERLGPEHMVVVISRNNLAVALERQGKYEDAETEIRKVLEVWREVLGPKHPRTGIATHSLGVMLHGQGKHEEAEAQLRIALATSEDAVGSDHPQVAQVRSTLADTLCDLGRASEALPLAELAWQRHRRDDTPEDAEADAASVLARALWTVESPQRDRARARALAEDALQSFRGMGAVGDKTQHLEQWLATHPAGS